MKRFLACLLAFSLACFLLRRREGEKGDAKDDGFKTIFDGKSMDGWKVNENKELQARGRAIVANSSGHCFYVGDESHSKIRAGA